MSDTPDPVGAWFPLLAFVRDARKVTGSGLIPDTVADFRATVAAANKLTGTLQRLAEFLAPLFQGPEFAGLDTPPPPVAGPILDGLRGRKRRRVIEAVKRAAEQEFREHGLARAVAACADRYPGYKPRSVAPCWNWEIESVWPRAVAEGAEEFVLGELERIEGFRELVDSVEGIGDFFRRIWDWIWAHREQIEWIGKVLLMFLSILLFL